MSIQASRAIALITLLVALGLYLVAFPGKESTGSLPSPAAESPVATQAPQSPAEAVQAAPPADADVHQSTVLEETQGDTEAPGEDIHFALSLEESTHHLVRGTGSADIGAFAFESKRLPSNEVELVILLQQEDLEDIEMTAYFDLANFTMELDGQKRILNTQHKQLLDLASAGLEDEFRKQYDGYDLPEHALMLSQMMAYWSVSPEGYVHEKRVIVSR